MQSSRPVADARAAIICIISLRNLSPQKEDSGVDTLLKSFQGINERLDKASEERKSSKVVKEVLDAQRQIWGKILIKEPRYVWRSTHEEMFIRTDSE